MDDFPQDELDDHSFHITPSSSVLAALSSLNPPSPILSPSQLSFTWSSGDIPVVLFNDAYAIDGRAPAPTPTTNTSIRYGDSCASSDSTGTRTRDFSRRNSRVESQSDNDSFHASGSSSTLASVGTFGPRRTHLKLCRDTRLSIGTAFPEIPSPTSGTVDYERRGTMFTRHHARALSNKTLPGAAVLAALTSQASSETVKGLASGILSDNDKNTVFPLLRSPADISTWEHSAYELPKVTEARTKVTSNRTASWISSQEWDSPQKQDYGFPEIISPVNGAPTEGKYVLTSPVTPTRHGILIGHDMNLFATSSPRILREHQSRKSSHQVDTSHTKHVRQPKEDFPWLRGITVQCLIDQEGFRTAQPSFKLSGIVHLRSSLEPRTPGPATAQFRPITRQSFHFHHAAFETPPILRRVSTNNQETHDYVSKQAQLTLKCNGVYVVHGHELSLIDQVEEAQKLSWQFEYRVDDRRVDGSGRVIEGEKILIPLTFSCSPELLLPAQGKRVNIMQVFKKGLAAKVSAEKLQPPGTPSVGSGSPCLVSPVKTDTRVHHSVFGVKTHAWDLHRRVQSHGTHQQDSHIQTVHNQVGIVHHGPRTAVESVNGDGFGRRRRASSVGDHSQTASCSPKIPRNPRHDSPGIVPSTFPRHIIPPSRLAELFDNTEISQPVPASICEPTTLTSLTPRPRSRHAWREKSGDFLRR